MNDKKQEVTTVKGGLALQDQLLGELDSAAKNMGQDFTPYGKKCVLNAIASLVIYTKQNGISITDFDPTLIRLALQNIGYTELNIAAIPSECYFDIRKTKEGMKTLTIKPQGAGNEKLLRAYGVNVKEVHNAWLIREGDEFTYPSFNGLDMTPPKWTPKSYDKKIIMVVYPIVKNDNSVDYLIATRESVKSNLIALIRQNTIHEFKKWITYKGQSKEVDDEEKRDAFYAEIEKDFEGKSVDECISMDKYSKWINPTYTSGGSKEQMILRKMKNNALKNYPKEYRDAFMADAVKDMFEDDDDSLKVNKGEVIDAEVDPVKKVEKEINEIPQADAVPDFKVDEETGVVENPPKEEPKPQEVKGEEKPQVEEMPDDDLPF